MQSAAQPTATRLHWSPVPASWLVSAGLITLAALPHQIPTPLRRGLRHWLGAVAALAVATWVARSTPVLAMAILLLVVSVALTPASAEPFVIQTLRKDTVTPHQKQRRWLSEEILSEDPHGIQERTDTPDLLLDLVGDDEKHAWLDEATLGEHPLAIQERPVGSASDPDDGQSTFGAHK
jgi:hypothetical protein